MHLTFRYDSSSTSGNDSKGLLSVPSLTQMLHYHPLTDEFAQYKLAYGLGLEGRWGSTGTGQPFDVCGLEAYGHAGLDYGSGAMLSFYLPHLRLGISLATTSAARMGGATAGMNCSRPYKQLQYAVTARARARSCWKVLTTAPPPPHRYAASAAQGALVHAVFEDAGIVSTCPVANFTVPSAAECEDAPTVGTLHGEDLHCSDLLWFAAQSPSQLDASSACTAWLSHRSLKMLTQDLPGYLPPIGVDPSTVAIDLCLGSCGDVGAGPCWLRQKVDPWC